LRSGCEPSRSGVSVIRSGESRWHR
jgi:hypothetical protein